MRRARANSETRPSLYTAAGLDAVERGERRELRGTVAFAVVVNLAASGLVAIATSEVVLGIVMLALLSLFAAAYLRRLDVAAKRGAENRRHAVRELTARANELDPASAKAQLDRLHATRRRLYLIALLWGSVCIVGAAGSLALGPASAIEASGGGAVFLVIYVWLILSGIRKLDSHFEQAHADTRAFVTDGPT